MVSLNVYIIRTTLVQYAYTKRIRDKPTMGFCNLRREAGVLADARNRWPGHRRIVLRDVRLQLPRQAVEEIVDGLDVVGVRNLDGLATPGHHGVDLGAEFFKLCRHANAGSDGNAVPLVLVALAIHAGVTQGIAFLDFRWGGP